MRTIFLPAVALLTACGAMVVEMDPVRDAGRERDAGARVVDAGSPAVADAGSSGGGSSGVDAGPTDDQRLAALEAERRATWATRFVRATGGKDLEWDYAYDGFDTAGDNVPNPLRSESPIDDDWAFPQFGYRPNTPRRGVLTVDRLTRAAGDPYPWQKTGNIWRREPDFSAATGVTIEFEVKLFGSAADAGGAWDQTRDAFSLVYIDELGTYGVHLSADPSGQPWGVKAGGANPRAAGPWVTLPWNTTTGTFYRFTKPPGSTTFRVEVGLLGAAGTLVATGDATPFASRDGRYYSYPRVLVGDNSNEAPRLPNGALCTVEQYVGGQCIGGMNARFELTSVRVRRGAVPQGAMGPPLPPRMPPPLPPVAPSRDFGFDGGFGVFPGRDVRGTTVSPELELAGTYPFVDGGMIELRDGNVRAGYRWTGTSYTGGVRGLRSRGPITVELKARVLPDTGPQGFVTELIDGMGGGGFALSPGEVRLMLDTSNAGMTDPVKMDTTDRVHTYRLVRPCSSPGARDCLYVYLYIDDDPVPRIVDQKLGGTVFGGELNEDYTRISIGDLAYPVAAARAHVLIESLRWSPTAYGPPRRAAPP